MSGANKNRDFATGVDDKGASDDHIWKAVTFLSRLESLPPAVEQAECVSRSA